SAVRLHSRLACPRGPQQAQLFGVVWRSPYRRKEETKTMKQETTVQLAGGKSISIETGKLAKQAHGSVVIRIGDNVVLTTACSNPDPREGIDFFPLTVDYRVYTYAGGRIPAGFIKREGRSSEREILVCRMINRPIRPLFPETFRN